MAGERHVQLVAHQLTTGAGEPSGMRTGQSRYGDGQILSVPAVRKDGTRVSVEFTIVPFSDDAGRMDRHRRNHA